MAMTRPISEQVTFTQEGAGAVVRTMLDKALEVVSVIDYGADPTGVEDSAAAFRAAFAVHDTVFVPDGSYLLSTYAQGAYYGAPAIYLDRDGQRLITGGNVTFLMNKLAASSGGANPGIAIEIYSARGVRVAPFKLRNIAEVGTDMNSIDGIHIYNCEDVEIDGYDDTWRLGVSSGAIQGSIVARDSGSPSTSGSTYKRGVTIKNSRCRAYVNLKHHDSIRLDNVFIEYDWDAFRPSWIGNDPAPLKITGGSIIARNAVVRDSKIIVYRSSGNPLDYSFGYVEFSKAEVLLENCIVQVNRIYGRTAPTSGDSGYSATPEEKTKITLSKCDIVGRLYYSSTTDLMCDQSYLEGFISSLNDPVESPALIGSVFVSNSTISGSRALEDDANITTNIKFNNVDIYYERVSENCFNIRRAANTSFEADGVRIYGSSSYVFYVQSGLAIFGDVRLPADSSTAFFFGPSSVTHKAKIEFIGPVKYDNIYEQGGNVAYSDGIHGNALWSTNKPIDGTASLFGVGCIVLNRGTTAAVGWRNNGSAWVQF